MKYIVLVGDGMADWSIPSIGNKTPLQVAKTPHLDSVCAAGNLLRAKTVADGMSPGSDVALLTIMGYNPHQYYTGRAPLEAASMGLKVSPTATIFRCNTVTVENGNMKDYAADHITTPESTALIQSLNQVNLRKDVQFFPGISYRHLMVIEGDFKGLECTPPHDILDKPAEPHLPKGTRQNVIRDIMEESIPLFANHPINLGRIKDKHFPASQIWLWGQGKMPTLPNFCEKNKVNGGTVVSAVDLVKGIGKLAKLDVPEVPGATGYLDTNYAGKIEAGLKGLLKNDFVLIHVEAPDECGHQGRPDLKIQAIEAFDKNIIGPILKYIQTQPGCRLMVLPDHPTPCAIRTHVAEPIPVVVAQYPAKSAGLNQGLRFTEENANQADTLIESGHELMDYFINGTWDK